MRRREGQAMVEFAIALLAMVILIAAIADFAIVSSRHSEIYETLRGKAGANAMVSSAHDAPSILGDGQTPVPETSESSLAANFIDESDSDEIPLSAALSNWEFAGNVDSITVRDEVWMPPMEVGGVQ